MDPVIRTTDAQGQLTLPKGFENATVIIEQVSHSEVRVRRAESSSGEEQPFVEEETAPLSDRDRDRFLELLANPPAPNAALRQAVARYRARRD